MGQCVSWIGGELKLQPSLIHAQVKPAIIEDIIDTLQSIQSMNLIPKKTLESLAGKINHAASLLIPLRPFLQQMWAAIHSDPHSTTVWRKQIHHALTWFTVLFKPGSSALGRNFRLPDFLGWGVQVEIGTDASPWGLGGWLARDGVITHYYHSAISHHDIDLFQLKAGSCEGQQVLEALAILVAVRLWLPTCSERVQLRFRSDNVGALSMIVKMRPKTSLQAIVARELALAFSTFSFPPSAYHTPGVSHIIADKLSRFDDPSQPKARDILEHPALKNAVVSSVPERDRSFYRTLKDANSLHSKVVIDELFAD